MSRLIFAVALATSLLACANKTRFVDPMYKDLELNDATLVIAPFPEAPRLEVPEEIKKDLDIPEPVYHSTLMAELPAALRRESKHKAVGSWYLAKS